MKLVEDARAALRAWSVRLALGAGAAAGLVVDQPQLLSGIASAVPDRWKPVASALAGLLVAVAPMIALRRDKRSNGNGQGK